MNETDKADFGHVAMKVAEELYSSRSLLEGLCARLGVTVEETRLGLGEDYFGIAWAEITNSDKESSGVHIGFDYARYEINADGHAAGSGELLVPELAAVIRREKGLGLSRQVDNVAYAVGKSFPRVIDGYYPNASVCEDCIVVWRAEDDVAEGADILTAGETHVFVGIRGNAFDARSIEDGERELRALAARLEEFVAVVDVSLGAMRRKPKDVRDIVAGWCGEVAAFKHLGRGAVEPHWSEHWWSPYDIVHGEDRVEVKTCCSDGSAFFTLSPTELLEAKGRYRLMLLRVSPDIVDAVVKLLGKVSKGFGASSGHSATDRLARAVGRNAVELHKALIAAKIDRLLADRTKVPILRDERNPLAWLGSTAIDALAGQRASVTLPFSLSGDAVS